MKQRFRLLALSILAIFLLDQWTKRVILKTLALGDHIPVWDGILDIVHVRNRGAAFGVMSDWPETYRIPFFFILSFLTLGALIVYYFKLEDNRTPVLLSLSAIIGGALGNIYDRITLGEVVDFVSFHWYDRFFDKVIFGYRIQFPWEWPAFNVADMAISLGVTGLILLSFSPPPSTPQT